MTSARKDSLKLVEGVKDGLKGAQGEEKKKGIQFLYSFNLLEYNIMGVTMTTGNHSKYSQVDVSQTVSFIYTCSEH